MAGLQELEKVSNETLTAWRVSKKHGDIAKIMKTAQATRLDIQQAFLGVARPNLIKSINKFYGIKN